MAYGRASGSLARSVGGLAPRADAAALDAATATGGSTAASAEAPDDVVLCLPPQQQRQVYSPQTSNSGGSIITTAAPKSLNGVTAGRYNERLARYSQERSPLEVGSNVAPGGYVPLARSYSPQSSPVTGINGPVVPSAGQETAGGYGQVARCYSPQSSPVTAVVTATGNGQVPSFGFTQEQVACVCEVCMMMITF